MKRLILLITAAEALALVALPSAALAKRDRNHDRTPDKWERHFHLSLNVNQARRDQDHDGLNNKREFEHGTNPRDADTDNDGLEEGNEVETANTPRDNDTDNNGIEDGEENAGTIVGFTPGTSPGTGTLVIDPGNGQNVTGEVTGSTRIECRNRQEVENENENENENEAGDDSTVRM